MEYTALGPFFQGTILEADRRELPRGALAIGSNLEFYQGMLKKRPGKKPLSVATLNTNCYFLKEYVKYAGTILLILTTPTKIYRWNSTTNSFTDLTPVGGITGDAEIMPDGVGYLNNFYYTCGSTEKLHSWNGTDATFVAVAGAPQCRFVNVLANHVVAAHISGATSPMKVMWTDEGNPADWVTGPPAGDAGEADLLDPPGHIMGLWRIGDYLYVPREYSVERMAYEGPPLIFSFQVVDAAGCRAPASAAYVHPSTEPMMFYLGADNIHVFNGIVSRPLPETVRQMLRDNLNPAHIRRAVGAVWPLKNQYWLSFPSGSSTQNDMTLVWDYEAGRAFLWPVGFSALNRWQPRQFRAINDLSALFPSAPGAANVAVNAAAGNLNGAYTYKITFVTAGGETEGGTTSGVVNPANEQVDLTAIPVSPSGLTTSRGIYRTVAGGAQHKFVAFLAGNVVTIYTDNLADGGLLGNAPVVNTAKTINNLSQIAPTIDALSGGSGPALDVFGCGGYDSKIHLLDDTHTADGSTIIQCLGETGLDRLDYIGPKDFRRIYIDMNPSPATAVQVSLGVSWDGKNITWKGPKAIGASGWLDFRSCGEWVCLRIEHAAEESFGLLDCLLEWSKRPLR